MSKKKNLNQKLKAGSSSFSRKKGMTKRQAKKSAEKHCKIN